jgi:hypothetical protein
MARGCWDDFTDKFGFGDGDLSEVRDFNARDLIVKKLNELLKKYVAISYDRPGMHNSCLIVIFERREDWTDEQYIKGFQSDFVKNVDLQNTDFPKDQEIQDLIDDCYVEVDKMPDSDPTCKACGTTELLVPHPEPTTLSEERPMMCADCLLAYWRSKLGHSNSEPIPKGDPVARKPTKESGEVAKKDRLLDRRLVSIEVMSEQEMDEMGWKGDLPPVVLTFEGGYKVFPSRDSEGNGPGVLMVNNNVGRFFTLLVREENEEVHG